MKSVMMSIQPKWCELIASGKKTIEVRKTRPKLETPFKCYIYCTKAKDKASVDGYTFFADELYIDYYSKTLTCGHTQFEEILNGKVIGEFVCDNIWETFVVCDVHDELPSRPCEYWLDWESDIDDVPKEACLSAKEIMSYLGKQYNGFAWHISDLVIYDKPKELNEFYKEDFEEILSNWEDLFPIGVPSGCIVQYPPEPKKEDYIVKRPPQSWCYVEELV